MALGAPAAQASAVTTVGCGSLYGSGSYSNPLRLGTQMLAKGDGVFIPADTAYTYEAGPQGVEVLEFRNATRFHFMFQGNDELHWSRIASVLSANCEKWENEPPPSM